MTIAAFLDCMCLAPRASGLWLRYAALQNLNPFLELRPHTLHPGAIQGKEGIKFCHLATLALGERRPLLADPGGRGGDRGGAQGQDAELCRRRMEAKRCHPVLPELSQASGVRRR